MPPKSRQPSLLPGIAASLVAMFVFHTFGWASGPSDLKIIPKPASIKPAEGTFEVTRGTTIFTPNNNPQLKLVAEHLRDALKTQTGLRLAIRDDSSVRRAKGIRLEINSPEHLGGFEAYEIKISPESITIRADNSAGHFYGVQTLLQLISPILSPEMDSATKIRLPAMHIVDRPVFAWRGLMLDCSRTFLSLDYLKKYVDVCSFYKMNVLHLHLTDDQGWRLEIRKHPRLTEIGATFDPRFPGEISGYYTQKQMKELVKYAAERQVTLVPEIEMPAHCLALLKAHPELSCREGKDEYVIAPYQFLSDFDPAKEPQTPHGVLCVGNEKTFELIEDVLSEVIELFPSEYIHIAGDECPKKLWKKCPKCQARKKAEGLANEDELQSYFVKRVAGMVQARGRKAMGWEDILAGGLPPKVGLMSWRSFEPGIKAAQLGHPVVMASKSHVYFDYSYNRSPASLVYDYNPITPELNTPELKSMVLGGEACMWTHLARSEVGIDMSIFPRLLALAEVLWTPPERLEWPDFSNRMQAHKSLLKSKGVACFEWNPGLGLPNLTCGQDGRLWLVNERSEIYLRQGDHWERHPGEARQVTSDTNGTLWAVSTERKAGGYLLKRWSETKKAWIPFNDDAVAVQISVAPNGSLWATTEAYAIYRISNGEWTNVQGLAREIAVGSDGMAWILTMDPTAGGYELHAATPRGRFRRAQPLAAGIRLAPAGPGKLWLPGEAGSLRLLHNGKYHNRPGNLSVITASQHETWGLTVLVTNSVRLVRWTGRGWEDLGCLP